MLNGAVLKETLRELKRWAEERDISDFLIPEFYIWLFRHKHLIRHPSTVKYLFAVWLRCYDMVSIRTIVNKWGLNIRIFYKWMRRLCPDKIDVAPETNTEGEGF